MSPALKPLESTAVALGCKLIESTQQGRSDITLLLTYLTIKQNPGITVNQLRWLLGEEFLFTSSVVDAAVATLTSRALLGSVSKWHVAGSDVIHLRCKHPDPEWVINLNTSIPGMASFHAPVLRKKRKGVDHKAV